LSEAKESWVEFLRTLAAGGLSGVQLVVCNGRAGLKGRRRRRSMKEAAEKGGCLALCAHPGTRISHRLMPMTGSGTRHLGKRA
jgi:hypothetical protein